MQVTTGLDRPQYTNGTPMTHDGARLIAALTKELGCTVVLVRNLADSASGLTLMVGGTVLGVEKEAKRRGKRLVPVVVATIPDDATAGISGALEEVPQHGIGYGGSVSRTEPEELAQILARHYRPALDPEAPPWTRETPWAPTTADEGH
ncbi:hypothetical protein [Streptomyces sp. G-5]|uniref:hypothetical protein n=1 Tax=Streptomyces sp. G-5 TaxID=2977231 RepID=UPI0021D2733A|nr:hypothetical protein [Streptomyces sp. G-5]MCU4750219.1 hypothetical protein [Streptomyces sp. G-5]